MERVQTDLLTDIFRAYYDARRHKRNTRSQLAFEVELERNLIGLYEDIRDRRYSPSPGICFITDHPVKREIFASPFRDRVVHHLLYNYLAPEFDARMIFDSYSCRKGKGTLKGIERFEHHLRSCTRNYTRSAYILKLDLRGYFMSIDKSRLYGIIDRTLARSRHKIDGYGDGGIVDYLLRAILLRNPTDGCRVLGSSSDWRGLPPSKSLLASPPGVGLPIGDLTSQLFSNIYLNVLDAYVKRTLKCRHYGRYVDDFYVIHPSREYLRRLIPEIREFLAAELRLTLHPNKIALQHYTKGAIFLGAVIRPYRRHPTVRTAALFRRAAVRMERELAMADPTPEKLVYVRSVLNSYCGYLGHFRAYRMLGQQLDGSPIEGYFKFTRHYRKAVIRPAPPWAESVRDGSSAGRIRGRHAVWPGIRKRPERQRKMLLRSLRSDGEIRYGTMIIRNANLTYYRHIDHETTV